MKKIEFKLEGDDGIGDDIGIHTTEDPPIGTPPYMSYNFTSTSSKTEFTTKITVTYHYGTP